MKRARGGGGGCGFEMETIKPPAEAVLLKN